MRMAFINKSKIHFEMSSKKNKITNSAELKQITTAADIAVITF